MDQKKLRDYIHQDHIKSGMVRELWKIPVLNVTKWRKRWLVVTKKQLQFYVGEQKPGSAMGQEEDEWEPELTVDVVAMSSSGPRTVSDTSILQTVPNSFLSRPRSSSNSSMPSTSFRKAVSLQNISRSKKKLHTKSYSRLMGQTRLESTYRYSESKDEEGYEDIDDDDDDDDFDEDDDSVDDFDNELDDDDEAYQFRVKGAKKKRRGRDKHHRSTRGKTAKKGEGDTIGGEEAGGRTRSISDGGSTSTSEGSRRTARTPRGSSSNNGSLVVLGSGDNEPYITSPRGSGASGNSGFSSSSSKHPPPPPVLPQDLCLEIEFCKKGRPEKKQILLRTKEERDEWLSSITTVRLLHYASHRSSLFDNSPIGELIKIANNLLSTTGDFQYFLDHALKFPKKQKKTVAELSSRLVSISFCFAELCLMILDDQSSSPRPVKTPLSRKQQKQSAPKLKPVPVPDALYQQLSELKQLAHDTLCRISSHCFSVCKSKSSKRTIITELCSRIQKHWTIYAAHRNSKQRERSPSFIESKSQPPSPSDLSRRLSFQQPDKTLPAPKSDPVPKKVPKKAPKTPPVTSSEQPPSTDTAALVDIDEPEAKTSVTVAVADDGARVVGSKPSPALHDVVSSFRQPDKTLPSPTVPKLGGSTTEHSESNSPNVISYKQPEKSLPSPSVPKATKSPLSTGETSQLSQSGSFKQPSKSLPSPSVAPTDDKPLPSQADTLLAVTNESADLVNEGDQTDSTTSTVKSNTGTKASESVSEAKAEAANLIETKTEADEPIAEPKAEEEEELVSSESMAEVESVSETKASETGIEKVEEAEEAEEPESKSVEGKEPEPEPVSETTKAEEETESLSDTKTEQNEENEEPVPENKAETQSVPVEAVEEPIEAATETTTEPVEEPASEEIKPEPEPVEESTSEEIKSEAEPVEESTSEESKAETETELGTDTKLNKESVAVESSNEDDSSMANPIPNQEEEDSKDP